MLRKTILALAAIAGLCAPVQAQTFTLPEIGLQNSGTCRQLAVRDRSNSAQVQMGCVDTSTHGWVSTPNKLTLPTTDQGSTGVISGMSTLARGGSTVRTFADRALDMGVNARDFGAVCDGATDNGPAFRAAFAAARVVRYDLEGCAGHYIVNTTVPMPSGRSLIGPLEGIAAPLGIVTTAAVDTFTASDQFAFDGVRLEHRGTSGSPINLGGAQYGSIKRSAISGTDSSNTAPLIYTEGSLVTVRDNSFTNNRTNAYAITINGPGSTSPIVHRIEGNNFGGSGKGTSIGSASGGKRPEGIYLISNHYFLSNVSLLVNAVLDLHSVGNTYDIGSVNQVVLAGSGQGIDMATFDGDYFSTLNQTTNGVCMQISGPTARVTVRSKFAYCGYGVTATDGNTSNLIVSASMVNMGNIGLNLQGVKGATITGNTCTSCASNFLLADGSAGGSYFIDGNQWDPNGTATINKTSAANFRFGFGNSGVATSGFSSAAASITSTGCYTISINHGLTGTPDVGRIVLTPGVASGTMSNITAAVTGVSSTIINAQVCATVSASGTVRVVANASL